MFYLWPKTKPIFIFCSQGNDLHTCANKLDSMSEPIINNDEELSESAVIDVPLELCKPEVVGGTVDGVVKESKVVDGTADTDKEGVDRAAEVVEDVDGAVVNDTAGSSSNKGRTKGLITSSFCISADEAISIATVNCRKEHNKYNSDVLLFSHCMRNQLPSKISSLTGLDVNIRSSSIEGGNSVSIKPSCVLTVDNDSDGDNDDDVVGGLKLDTILPLSTFERVIGDTSKRVAESSLEIGIDVDAAAVIALDV